MAWGKCVTGFWGLPGEGEELQDELQRPRLIFVLS